jgi:hypothetical protein
VPAAGIAGPREIDSWAVKYARRFEGLTGSEIRVAKWMVPH